MSHHCSLLPVGLVARLGFDLLGDIGLLVLAGRSGALRLRPVRPLASSSSMMKPSAPFGKLRGTRVDHPLREIE